MKTFTICATYIVICESLGYRPLQGRCPKGDQPTDKPNDITTQPGVESRDTRLKMIYFLKRQKN